jgi:hypothetical protein
MRPSKKDWNERYRSLDTAEFCSFEMVNDIALIYQQIPFSFTADFAVSFLSK